MCSLQETVKESWRWQQLHCNRGSQSWKIGEICIDAKVHWILNCDSKVMMGGCRKQDLYWQIRPVEGLKYFYSELSHVSWDSYVNFWALQFQMQSGFRESREQYYRIFFTVLPQCFGFFFYNPWLCIRCP